MKRYVRLYSWEAIKGSEPPATQEVTQYEFVIDVEVTEEAEKRIAKLVAELSEASGKKLFFEMEPLDNHIRQMETRYERMAAAYLEGF